MSGCAVCDHVSIVPGSGIGVSGSGSVANPYVIESTLFDASRFLTVIDSETVNLSLGGAGTEESPHRLRADVQLRMTDLLDIDDPSGGPTAGEVPIWVGSGADGHFEFGQPPAAPAGAVNVGSGLAGDGTAGAPLVLRTSGVWGEGDLAGFGTDDTVGRPVYVDSDGVVRTSPPSDAGRVDWGSIDNKPTSFFPAPHSHPAAAISAAEQLKMNVGRINGRTITVTSTSSTPPANPAAFDLWFFPKGA